jgi:hypothetical protein
MLVDVVICNTIYHFIGLLQNLKGCFTNSTLTDCCTLLVCLIMMPSFKCSLYTCREDVVALGIRHRTMIERVFCFIFELF